MSSDTTAEYSDESGEKTIILTPIENQSDTIPNRQESGDDSDSEEDLFFPFGYRGKQRGKTAGDNSDTKTRPPKDKKAEELVKAEEKKAKEVKGKGKDGNK